MMLIIGLQKVSPPPQAEYVEVKISSKCQGSFGPLVMKIRGPSISFSARFGFSNIFYTYGIEMSQYFSRAMWALDFNIFVGPHQILRAIGLMAHVTSTPRNMSLDFAEIQFPKKSIIFLDQ